MKWLLFLLFISPLGAMGLDCNDFNVIYCAPMNEGWGVKARDQSRSGLDADLVGGPIWLEGRASFTNWGNKNFAVTPGSFTYAPMNGHYIYFVGINGEEVDTATTTILDFSGNKPFMLAFVMKTATILFTNPASPIMMWDNGLNNCGWDIETEINGTSSIITFVNSGQNTQRWGTRITDSRPHSYGLWRDGSGNLDLYYDGTLASTFSGMADLITCAGGAQLQYGAQKVGATGDLNYSIGFTQIWNTTISRSLAGDFFNAWHLRHVGSGN